jgi:hypothetical protein
MVNEMRTVALSPIRLPIRTGVLHMNEPGRFHPDPTRRRFVQMAALGGLAFSLPQARAADNEGGAGDASFDGLSRDLLRDWCDGMLKVQIHNPANPALHGALGCPACDIIHGRCMDAVYPFLHMAKVTGQAKYLDAGVAVFEWSKNVSHDDGSWTVIADPKSWKGITVFGAIALAETLHRHGDLLDAATRQRWYDRLGRAGDYLHKTFTAIGFSNINYGCTGTFAFVLLGRVLDRPAYFERSRHLVSGLKDFLTKPNGLLFGEGKAAAGASPRGCRPVDLGYNVEESLVALALCAKATGDADLAATVVRLLQSHLEFMLPDGGWDNSWGTRHAKWTYWGSRTSDGCQPGYALFAGDHPAFATAVIENTRLYRRCTANGLLHGGPHYASHGVKPCVHHTFTHAKALATLRDHGDLPRRIHATAPLPRAVADGVREYPEIATWLAARGPWRATVTASDWTYHKQVRQPTGGALSMLWHQQAGPLLAGSMAAYYLVEKYNMQQHPDPGDHPLTPRIELWQDDTWFTQLYELAARVVHSDKNGVIGFEVSGRLLDDAGREPARGKSGYSLIYQFDAGTVLIAASAPGAGSGEDRPRLVLPLVSPTGESVSQPAPGRIEIQKPRGKVVIEANAPLRVQKISRSRIFNLVPGFEAVPIIADIPPDARLECRVRVIPS